MTLANIMSTISSTAPAITRSAAPRHAAAPRPSGQRNVAMRAGFDEFTIPPWSLPPPQETNGLPPIPKERSDQIKSTFMENFAPPPESYGHNSMGVSEAEWKARVDLAAVYRLCVHYGLHEGIVNHMTAWVPDDEVMLVHSFGLGWDEVTASNLLAVNKDGEVLRGQGNPEATAFFIHSRLHLNRKAEAPTLAVLHTHMPHTTALCGLEYPKLPMIHQNPLKFYDDIVYDPKLALRIESSEEGDRLAAALGPKRILLQSNHGPMICAESMDVAFDYLYYLERAAQMACIARQNGLPLREAHDAVGEAWKEYTESTKHYSKMHFEANKRMLLRDPIHKEFIV